MCDAVLETSIIGRAQKKGAIEAHCHQIRTYTQNRQMQVDDYPYGGGKGLVMFAQPIADCFRAVCDELGHRPHFIYMSPQGKTLTQKRAVELSKLPELCILCGHYEGVDERVLESLVDEQISVGDYVLTGGELAAITIIDAVSRLVPGVLGKEESFADESFSEGLLEYPQYTRPPVFMGREVPEVLLSGDHAKIRQWRHEQSLRLTQQRRPDLLAKKELSDKDRELLERFAQSEKQSE